MGFSSGRDFCYLVKVIKETKSIDVSKSVCFNLFLDIFQTIVIVISLDRSFTIRKKNMARP